MFSNRSMNPDKNVPHCSLPQILIVTQMLKICWILSKKTELESSCSGMTRAETLYVSLAFKFQIGMYLGQYTIIYSKRFSSHNEDLCMKMALWRRLIHVVASFLNLQNEMWFMQIFRKWLWIMYEYQIKKLNSSMASFTKKKWWRYFISWIRQMFFVIVRKYQFKYIN